MAPSRAGFPTQRRIGGSTPPFPTLGNSDDRGTLGALSALRGTFDLAKLAIDVRDGNKLNEARIAMNERLIDLTSSALALQEKQAALVQENRRWKHR